MKNNANNNDSIWKVIWQMRIQERIKRFYGFLDMIDS